MTFHGILINFFIVSLVLCCGSSDEDAKSTEVPPVFLKIYAATDIYVEGDFVVIKTNGLPDHKSPYYDNTQWESSLYEAYNGSNPNFAINPNKIAGQRFTFKIPLKPMVSASHSATPLGPMGVSLNGVPFFNQYAGPNQPLTNEINSFDQYFGHPTANSIYHYHAEPYYLTASKGDDALLGFLLDGFPVYGPTENGETVVNGDLDVYHGHTHATADFPNEIYHYHITSEDPYINGSGYYGTPGTVSN